MFTRPAIALAETTIGLYNPTSATLVSGMKGRGWPSLPAYGDAVGSVTVTDLQVGLADPNSLATVSAAGRA